MCFDCMPLHGSHRLSGTELTGAPKARIVSFPTRRCGDGLDSVGHYLEAPAQSGLFLAGAPTKNGTASSVQGSPYMSSRADMYRQRADDAKNRAAQAKNLSIKSAFEEVAACWLVLAEQVEWIDRKEASPPRRKK
jgi:hypothetical protein